MAKKSPYEIKLSQEECHELESRAVKYSLPYYQVVRAKIILMAAEGLPNDEIAHRLDTQRMNISFWRKRFYEQRLEGLEERARPGRPRSFSPSGDHAGKGRGLRASGPT